MTGATRKPLLAAAIVAAVALIAPVAASAQAPQRTTWSPTELGFQKTKVGKKSEVSRVTVYPNYNCGEDWAPPTICTPTWGFLDMAVSGPYEIVSTTCRQGENGSSSCFVDVAFRPRSRGRQDGFLRLTQNAYQRPGIQGVPLTGKGCRKYGDRLRCKRKK